MNSIVEKLARIAARSSPEDISQKTTESDIQLQVEEMAPEGGFQVLILGAGRMCEPAVKYLASTGRQFGARKSSWVDGPVDERVWVVVASLFLEDAQKVRKKTCLPLFHLRRLSLFPLLSNSHCCRVRVIEWLSCDTYIT